MDKKTKIGETSAEQDTIIDELFEFCVAQKNRCDGCFFDKDECAIVKATCYIANH